jgi:uncharacterized protein (DUF1330 family)
LHEILVALNVIDDQKYQEYRKSMMPILKDHGGGFNYDFRVSDVLISQTEHDINRVFTIYFPDKERSEQFFSNPDYLEVRKTYFDKSVKSSVIISEYERK